MKRARTGNIVLLAGVYTSCVLLCHFGSSNGGSFLKRFPLSVRPSHFILCLSLHVVGPVVLQQQRAYPVTPVVNLVFVMHEILGFLFIFLSTTIQMALVLSVGSLCPVD